jgi:inhibitor of KinA sporulation pathway (predicted exonuclease)
MRLIRFVSIARWCRGLHRRSLLDDNRFAMPEVREERVIETNSIFCLLLTESDWHVGITEALRHLDLRFEGSHHRWLDDARNVDRIVRRVCAGC